jgi:hypothetical protein
MPVFKRAQGTSSDARDPKSHSEREDRYSSSSDSEESKSAEGGHPSSKSPQDEKTEEFNVSLQILTRVCIDPEQHSE